MYMYIKMQNNKLVKKSQEVRHPFTLEVKAQTS